MAVLTEPGLRLLIESLVTLRAIVFPLGVPFDDLSWHKGCFDGISPGGSSHERQGGEQEHCIVRMWKLHDTQEGSVHIYGHNVKDGASGQDVNEWNVEDVP